MCSVRIPPGSQAIRKSGCVHTWEARISEPEIRHLPAIIEFLGYNPLPEVETMGERLVRQRTTLGLTQWEAAERLGIDTGAGEAGAGWDTHQARGEFSRWRTN
jgi:hypothetical protein